MRTKRDYEGDVWHRVWRAGGDPDLVDGGRLDDYYHDGWDEDAAAATEIRRQRRAHEDEEV